MSRCYSDGGYGIDDDGDYGGSDYGSIQKKQQS